MELNDQFLLMHDIGHDLALGVSHRSDLPTPLGFCSATLSIKTFISLRSGLSMPPSLRSVSLTIQTSISLRSGLPMSPSLSSVLDHPHKHLSQEWPLYVSVTIVV